MSHFADTICNQKKEQFVFGIFHFNVNYVLSHKNRP